MIEASRAVCASLTPATVEQIAMSIEALALHFPTLRRTEAEHRIVAHHWADDLAGWPADLIEEACRQWRNSSKDRFPTAGQLKALVQPIFDHRQSLGRRAREYIALENGGLAG